MEPDVHGDWLKQRDASYTDHIVAGSKDKDNMGERLFENFSLGVATARDAWAFNPSKRAVVANIQRMIELYNGEVGRMAAAYPGLDRRGREAVLNDFVDPDPTRISWSDGLKRQLIRGDTIDFDGSRPVRGLYRAFSPAWLYHDRRLIDRLYQMPRIFPASTVENLVIGVSGIGSRPAFSCLMADAIPSLDILEKAQFFPLHLYDTDSPEPDDNAPAARALGSLFVAERPPPVYNAKCPSAPVRRDGITDAGLAHFQSAYPSEKITKEDVFYYVYGILHSPDYRERYADNLGKELPRIPRVVSASDFHAFSNAGRLLGDLHVGYEQVPEYPARVEGLAKPTAAQLRVENMRFGKGKDKTVIHYNAHFTVRDIPLEAYEYVVNGKPAIEWVMERQAVTTDKASGIVKDANAWATETVGDPRYPLSLLLRVITVSLRTQEIVRGLPALNV